MGAVGSLPEPCPTGPPGSIRVRHKRLTTFPGNFLQVTAALLFASYFFFWPIGVLVWLSLSPWALNVASWRTLWSFSGLYTLQLFMYQPHKSKGWPFYKWFLCGWLSDYCLCYHDATCIREGPAIDPAGQYMFAMYPHGVYGVCRVFSGGMRLWRTMYPGIFSRWGSFSAAFYLPGIREFSLFAGCLDASKPVLEKAIKRGESVTLLPGGIDEMNLTDGRSKVTKLVTLDRKGFVKLAIENGMDIVPGFCFGEKYIHETVRLPAVIRQALRPFRLSGTLLSGRWFTFLGFLKPSLGYVWGEPVRVNQQKPVEEAYLDEIHGKVIQAVSSMFDRHKEKFGYDKDEVLEMVSAADAKALTSGKKKKDS